MSNVTMSFSNFFTVVELYWLLKDVWDMARMYRTAWHHYLEIACICRPYFDWGLMRANVLLFHQDDGRTVITTPSCFPFRHSSRPKELVQQGFSPWAGKTDWDTTSYSGTIPKYTMIFFFLVLYINTSCWCTWYCCRTSNGRNVLPTCLIGFNRGVLGTDSDSTHGTPIP